MLVRQKDMGPEGIDSGSQDGSPQPEDLVAAQGQPSGGIATVGVLAQTWQPQSVRTRWHAQRAEGFAPVGEQHCGVGLPLEQGASDGQVSSKVAQPDTVVRVEKGAHVD